MRSKQWTSEMIEFATYLYTCKERTIRQVVDDMMLAYGDSAKISESNASTCLKIGQDRHHDKEALMVKFDREAQAKVQEEKLIRDYQAPSEIKGGREGLELLRDIAIGLAFEANQSKKTMDFSKFSLIACKLQDSVTKTKSNAANQGHIVEQRGIVAKLKETAKARAKSKAASADIETDGTRGDIS
jgi:hypothetical protein